MLERMLLLRKVCYAHHCSSSTLTDNVLVCQGVNRFIQLANDSDEVPKLQGKSYAGFKLSSQEWAKMELMRDVLQVHLYFCLFWLTDSYIIGAC